MTDYKTEFPHYASTIPPVFLTPPWRDVSWANDSCPSFSRTMGDGCEFHVYVDEEDPSRRDVWTSRNGDQTPCPRFSVRVTDKEGSFTDDDSLDFTSDSLAEVLDRVGFLVG